MKLEMYEGDSKELEFDVPSEFNSGTATLLIEINKDEGIVKRATVVDSKAVFKLDTEDTVTRCSTYIYEVRAEKDEQEKVIEQDLIKIKDSLIVRTDVVANELVAFKISNTDTAKLEALRERIELIEKEEKEDMQPLSNEEIDRLF